MSSAKLSTLFGTQQEVDTNATTTTAVMLKIPPKSPIVSAQLQMATTLRNNKMEQIARQYEDFARRLELSRR